MHEAYHLAQSAIADLKAAVYRVLADGSRSGLTNAEIGRTLGIHGGHIGHEGHISRTLLAMLESEGVAEQEAVSKRWRLKPATADTLTVASARDQGTQTVDDPVEDVEGLVAADVVGKRVRCPACATKVFERWPEGWDAHAAHRCPGLQGQSESDRKTEFRSRFGRLFR